MIVAESSKKEIVKNVKGKEKVSERTTNVFGPEINQSERYKWKDSKIQPKVISRKYGMIVKTS